MSGSSVLAACLCIAGLSVSAAPAPSSLAIVRVGVIDVVGGTVLPDRTVIISGDRIERIADGVAPLPDNARVVDGRGGYLMPGLWDMHVHLSYARSSAFPALIANGVTYVRDLGSRLAEIDEWRGQIAGGMRPGPFIVRAGPILNGREFNRFQLEVGEPGDARAIVRALDKVGVDLVKVHRRTPREAYFAIADEARRLALPLAGHVPMTVTPAEAAAAGQTTIEHIETLFEGTFSAALEGRPLADAIAGWRQSPAAGELFRTLVKNGTIVNPTLIAGRRVNAWLEHPDDPRDKYLPASGWREAADTIKSLRQDAAARLAERRPAWREMEGVVGDLHRAGVRLVTGTDLAHFLIHPGFSLHDELQALVDAGLTATEAVRAATLHPAALFPHLDAGELAPGKHASLVLLDANPLDDIRHAARIRAVIAGGRLYDRAALERLLGEAVALAAVN